MSFYQLLDVHNLHKNNVIQSKQNLREIVMLCSWQSFIDFEGTVPIFNHFVFKNQNRFVRADLLLNISLSVGQS